MSFVSVLPIWCSVGLLQVCIYGSSDHMQQLVNVSPGVEEAWGQIELEF